jgi:hypothetical protein
MDADSTTVPAVLTGWFAAAACATELRQFEIALLRAPTVQ